MDAVKLSVLYWVYRGLLGGDLRNTIHDDGFQLVDDLDAVDRFPWGSLAWMDMAKTIRERVLHHYNKVVRDHQSATRKEEAKKYAIMGYPWAFQVHLYNRFACKRL